MSDTMARELDKVQERLGVRFRDAALLRRALRHASAAGGSAPSYERLEFLGDAVVGLAVAEHLFRSMPGASEGEMTVVKSGVVSRRALGRVARDLGLHEHVEVGEGLQGQRYPLSIVSGVYEAVVGALFVDSGMDVAREFVLRTVEDEIAEACEARNAEGAKSVLQQKTQAEGKGVPHYEIVSAEGPDHALQFQAVVLVAEEKCGEGWGRTKKEAESNAARQALERLYPQAR
jgi:ribonuclease-3